MQKPKFNNWETAVTLCLKKHPRQLRNWQKLTDFNDHLLQEILKKFDINSSRTAHITCNL